VFKQQDRQKIGAFAWARPQSWGFAARLKNPEQFNCITAGGREYLGGQRLEINSAGTPPAASNQNPAPAIRSGSDYDKCMARVMRISDPDQRRQSMPMCDSAN
jgi:hypothetical protein